MNKYFVNIINKTLTSGTNHFQFNSDLQYNEGDKITLPVKDEFGNNHFTIKKVTLSSRNEKEFNMLVE